VSPLEPRRLVQTLNALGREPEIAKRYALRELSRHEATEILALLEQLLARVREGDGAAKAVLGPLLAALHSVPLRGRREEIERRALEEGRESVVALFSGARARREMDQGVAAKHDALAFSQTLGHLKTMARLTKNPDELAKLALFSNPSVVRNALINPRLTEQVVVRIASRRPARPEPLIEIFNAPRWSSRLEVRRALVFNPYLPPSIGAKIVPTLSEADLKLVAQDGSLHPDVRAQAQALLSRGQRAG
jgi:hypothetical protein